MLILLLKQDRVFIETDMPHLLSCPYIVKHNNKNSFFSSSRPRTAQMMIISLGAVTGFEKYCIISAHLQWLFHSGERAVAHGCNVTTITMY